MYTTVPTVMLKMELFFQKWTIAVTATPASSIRLSCSADSGMLFRQYTTRVAIIAIGNTFPRYSIRFGSSLLFNKRNGKARKPKVSRAGTRIDNKI